MYPIYNARRIVGNFIVSISNVRNWGREEWQSAFEYTNLVLVFISIVINSFAEQLYSRGGVESGNMTLSIDECEMSLSCHNATFSIAV